MAAGNEVIMPNIAAANGVIHGIDGMDLQSFRFQLNLSSSVHRVTRFDS
jgi:hypothetical protein